MASSPFLYPRLDVLRVVFARFRAESEMRTDECRPEFCDEFFGSVGAIAEALS
jgi:hypothetical protein